MKQKNYRWRNLGRLLAMMLLLILSVTAYAREEYIHDFFRYIVEDDSVTIIAYTGSESEVTVPAMIGGHPVNTIAPGAFTDTAVTMVILPETIESVEPGAFGPGQTVITGSAAPEGETQMPGIRDDQGNLITTDDQGNLILVDQNGDETVLDDTHIYTREMVNGSPVIRGEGGKPVSVLGDGRVSVPSEQGETVIRTDSPVEADGNPGEVPNAPDVAEVEEPEDRAEEAGGSPSFPWIWFALLILCGAGLAIFLIRKKPR